MPFDYKKEYHRYKKLYFKKAKGLYKKPLTKASLNIAVSLLVISAFLFFAIRPTIKTISELNRKIKNQKEVSKKLSRKITSLQTAEKNYNSIENDLTYLETALPPVPKFVSGAKKLVYLAHTNNLKLKHGSFSNFKLIESNSRNQLKELEFQFTTFGKYKDIQTFIESTEELRRVFTFDEVNLKSEGSKLKLVLQGSFYWYTRGKQ